MADKRTYRRVPKDVAEAKYISSLIDADVKSRTTELAGTGDFTQLRDLLNIQEAWRSIVGDLAARPEPVAVEVERAPKPGEAVPDRSEGGAATSPRKRTA